MPNEKHMDVAENLELIAGAAGAVVAVDQIAKGLESKDHTISHLSKAAISAAVAIGAYELLKKQQENEAYHEQNHHHHHHRDKSSPASDSIFEPHEHHLVKEIIGAYGLGKELMGDKRHHFSHLVEQAIGAVGLLQDVQEHTGHKDVKLLKEK